MLYAWVMQGPPGSNAKPIGGFTIQPPSVLIFGNPSLYDISALSKLGQCSTTPSTDAGTIFIEVCLHLSLTQGAEHEITPQRTGYVCADQQEQATCFRL